MDYNHILKIQQLLLSKLQRTITEEQQQELDLWLSKRSDNQTLLEELRNEEWLAEQLAVFESIEVKPLHIFPQRRSFIIRHWGWVAVASVMLIASAGIYLWNNSRSVNTSTGTIVVKRSIQPGKDGAILTLADGSEIVLDSLGNGVVAAQNGAQAVINNGSLVYNPTAEEIKKVDYNTIHTPRGRQFNILLPDGSRAFLNCDSRIKFPTSFHKERIVEVSGEVYFEVTKNPNLPFTVQMPNKSSIRVLGTSFNVNAYNDEPALNATLFEGRIQYTSSDKQFDLTPGKQLEEGSDGKCIVHNLSEERLNDVIAWKKGEFNISGSNFSTLLRQLSRWYNVEIEVAGTLPVTRFSASISKKIPLENILESLEPEGITWRQSGNKIIVMPRKTSNK